MKKSYLKRFSTLLVILLGVTWALSTVPAEAIQTINSVTLRVGSGGGPLRTRYYGTGSQIRRLSAGESVTVTAITINSYGNLWFRVGHGNQWTHHANLQISGTVSIPATTFAASRADVPVRNGFYSTATVMRRLSNNGQITVNGFRRNSHNNIWLRLTDGTWIYSGNVRLGLIWHSYDNEVHFWPGTVNVHTRTIGTVSPAFQFGARVTEARHAWGSALGINIGTATRNNAQIVATGGPRRDVELDQGSRVGTTAWTGLARRATRRHEATLNIGGANRRVYRLSGQAQMWVVQRSTAAVWPQNDHNRTRKTTIHELGHTLGYWGHSPTRPGNNQDVMWYSSTPHVTLQPTERRHLRQIYNRFR